jgi:hypothetical protein
MCIDALEFCVGTISLKSELDSIGLSLPPEAVTFPSSNDVENGYHYAGA